MKVLIKGIISRLKAVPAVTGKVAQRIYTDVPQGDKFPYITIDISGDEAYTKTEKSQTYQVVLNSWSREKTMEQADDIIQAVKAALDRQESAISLDSGTLVRLEFVTEDCYKDPDGVTWHGLVILNAYIDFGG